MFNPQFQGQILALAGLFLAPPKVITANADLAVGDNDFKISINKTIASATALPLPTTSIPTTRGLIIYDGKGDAATNNITIQGGGNLIDGAANYVISRNYGLVWIEWDGSAWKVLAAVNGASVAVSGVTFTQTYALTSTTIAALTTLALTDSTGGSTADRTLAAVGATNTGDRSADINNNFAKVAREVTAIQADILAMKKNDNQIIDVLQAAGVAS